MQKVLVAFKESFLKKKPKISKNSKQLIQLEIF